MVMMTCSLNITIPSSVVVIWTHNNDDLLSNKAVEIGSTTTVLIENFQPSDTGFYRCIFDDTFGSGWTLTRNIILHSRFLYGYIMYMHVHT